MTTNAPLATLRDIWLDNADTWSLRTGADAKRDRRRAARILFGAPILVAGALLLLAYLDQAIILYNAGQLLAGVAVFTALLFALLVLMFNTGLAVRKDAGTLVNAHGLQRLIADLRANVTYSACVAILMASLLVVAVATDRIPRDGLHWAWTPVLAMLGLHLVLNLAVVLTRLRTAFNYLTR